MDYSKSLKEPQLHVKSMEEAQLQCSAWVSMKCLWQSISLKARQVECPCFHRHKLSSEGVRRESLRKATMRHQRWSARLFFKERLPSAFLALIDKVGSVGCCIGSNQGQRTMAHGIVRRYRDHGSAGSKSEIRPKSRPHIWVSVSGRGYEICETTQPTFKLVALQRRHFFTSNFENVSDFSEWWP